MTGGGTLDFRGFAADAPERWAGDLAAASGHLAAGGILAYPTETVYGLGTACTPEAVSRLQAFKGREPGKPFLVLVRDPEEVSDLAWTPEARELARIFWPGSLTLVLGDPGGTFPPGVRSESGTVAIRMSPHPLVAALLSGFGAPMTSTSANVPGSPAATSGARVLEMVASLEGGDDVLVLDAGELPESPSSTIVDCTGPEPVVRREGTIPTGRLRCVLPEIHGTTHR
ncbi:MAG: L-threonylcarbamoyladenylate synthase [Gemmatimonadota bacterium]|nr:L-threonylcarbamoyladenylate synthase [Gemmatimonadota bacterium]